MVGFQGFRYIERERTVPQPSRRRPGRPRRY
jgi:hypothetical protein